MKLSGKNLAEVTQIKTSEPRLGAKLVAPKRAQLELEVAPAADLPRGRYKIWVASVGGESNHQPLFVDDLASHRNRTERCLTKANSVSLPSGIWGVLAARGDVDRFTFEPRGQRLVFDIAASMIGSKANVILTLYDADGRVLSDNSDFADGADPLLAFAVPTDGRYVIEVSDLKLAGTPSIFIDLAWRVVAGHWRISVEHGRRPRDRSGS